jgi:hypothetical protein
LSNKVLWLYLTFVNLYESFIKASFVKGIPTKQSVQHQNTKLPHPILNRFNHAGSLCNKPQLTGSFDFKIALIKNS